MALLQSVRKKKRELLPRKFSQMIVRITSASLQHLQLNYASCNVKVDSLTFINFPENYQTAEIYTHIMLLHSIKQYVLILSTTITDKSS